MKMDALLELALPTGAEGEFAELLCSQEWLPRELPEEITLDAREVDPQTWLNRDALRFQKWMAVTWWTHNFGLQVDRRHPAIVFCTGERATHRIEVQQMLFFLRAAPFRWGFVESMDDPSEKTFGVKRLGPLVAFRGAHLHERVVSRRWLEHGPWVLRTYPPDLTVVYFNDPEAELTERVAQARPGHDFFREGFLPELKGYQMPPHASYLPEQRRLEVAVYGRRVTLHEMTDARWIWLDQGLGADRPLEKVAYTFADPAEAQPHLRDLWLREIEVVTFVDGKRTVLTDGYSPPPQRPAWTAAFEEKLAAEGL